MRGDLSETSVADLCRGLSDAEATGAVELDGPEGAARVFFRRGNVYWAMSPAPRARLGDRLVNGGLLTAEQLESALAAQRESTERLKLGAILVDQGLVSRDVIRVFVQEQILDAIFDLMRWRRGTYAFRAGDAASEKLPIDIPVDQLLVEVSRRQSEWDQIEAAIPHLDMVPDFVLGGSSANAALEPDEFAVLASVDGQRSIRELADALGYSHFEAARIVFGLTLLGIVDVSDDELDDVEPDEVDELYDEVSGAFETTSPTAATLTDAPDEAEDAADDEEDGAPAATETADASPETTVDASEDEDDDLFGGDLELELADLADDDLDIAAALEEALGGADTPPPPPSGPPSERPSVRVHVDDDVKDYAPPRQATGSGLEPTGEPRRTETPVPPPPAAETRIAQVADADDEDLTTALAAALEDAGPPPQPDTADLDEDDAAEAALDELLDADAAQATSETELTGADELEPVEEASDSEDVVDADVDVVPDEPVAAEDGDSDDGPSPWVAPAEDADDEPEPATSALDELAAMDDLADDAADEPEGLFGGLEEDAEEPADAPAAAAIPDPISDDSDFDALIDQLAGGPGSDDAPSRPYTSTPDEADDAAAPSEQTERPAASSSGGGSGDVSEFLRELSRLALDEPADGGAEPAPAKEPDRTEADAASEAAAQSKESPRPPQRDSDDKKKRGLFGWGR